MRGARLLISRTRLPSSDRVRAPLGPGRSASARSRGTPCRRRTVPRSTSPRGHQLLEQLRRVRLLLEEIGVGEPVGDRPAASSRGCRARRASRPSRPGYSTISLTPRNAAPCSAVSPRSLAALTSLPSSTHIFTASSDFVLLAGQRAAVFAEVPDRHAGGDHQRRRAVGGRGLRIGAGRDQQLHHLDVGVLGGEQKGVAPRRFSRLRWPSFMPFFVMRALTIGAACAIIFLITSMLSSVAGRDRPRRAEADVRPADAHGLVQRVPARAGGFGSAPRSSRTLASSQCALAAATTSALAPSDSVSFTSAPASSSA